MGRKAHQLLIFNEYRPLLEVFAKKLYRGGILLDVGTGEGVIGLEAAKVLGVEKTILVDLADYLTVGLPKNARLDLVDVCSEEFVRRYQNKVKVLTCFSAFHEFADPFLGAAHIVQVLPLEGVALLTDFTEKGWTEVRASAEAEGVDSLRHYEEDIRKLQKNGLRTDAGIRDFWENQIFPKVPGECVLTFFGPVYRVVYLPREWGEIKPFPG